MYGPNLFPMHRLLNQARSEKGRHWRRLETIAADNPAWIPAHRATGLTAFAAGGETAQVWREKLRSRYRQSRRDVGAAIALDGGGGKGKASQNWAQIYAVAKDQQAHFTNDFTSSLRGGRMEEFKRRYRQRCALLVMEGTQYRSMPGSRYGFTMTTRVPRRLASCRYFVVTG